MTTLKECKAMPVDTKVMINSTVLLDYIRVIELAEVALEVSLSMSENECWPVEEIIIRQALSEIRKLKR